MQAFLGRERYQRGAAFRGYRNGHGRERTVGIGTWAVPVKVPRVSDTPEGSPFESAVLPKRTRLSMATQKLFARLYLEGLSTGDFEPVFRQLLGGHRTALAEHADPDQGGVGGGVPGLAGATAGERAVPLHLGGRHLPRRRSGEGEQLPAHPPGSESGRNQGIDRDGDRIPRVESLVGRCAAQPSRPRPSGTLGPHR